jgi:subtilisin family serine protease
VVAVGAVDSNGKHAAISVMGKEVVLAAPGEDIVSTDPGRKYRHATGTSEATAIVSGAVALIRAKYPKMSAAEVVHRLTATATDAGPKGRDEQYGYGVINLAAALTANVPPLEATPSATATAGPAPTTTAAGPDGPTTRSLPTPILAGAALLLIIAAAGLVRAVRRRREPG